jgi:hypothetical protein
MNVCSPQQSTLSLKRRGLKIEPRLIEKANQILYAVTSRLQERNGQ